MTAFTRGRARRRALRPRDEVDECLHKKCNSVSEHRGKTGTLRFSAEPSWGTLSTTCEGSSCRYSAPRRAPVLRPGCNYCHPEAA
eukprot:scaffold97181_cov70-Phaeocystis_antarctica.AAC.1